MVNLLKKLATLLITLGFVSMSCAANYAPGIAPLAGNPKVETIGNTVGMNLSELNKKLGTPTGTDSCTLPFTLAGEDVRAQGKSFQWQHEYVNMRDHEARLTGIVVCTLNGIVMAEHREWLHRIGDMMTSGETDTIDRGMIQEEMDGLIGINPSGLKEGHLHRNKGFEI